MTETDISLKVREFPEPFIDRFPVFKEDLLNTPEADDRPGHVDDLSAEIAERPYDHCDQRCESNKSAERDHAVVGFLGPDIEADPELDPAEKVGRGPEKRFDKHFLFARMIALQQCFVELVLLKFLSGKCLHYADTVKIFLQDRGNDAVLVLILFVYSPDFFEEEKV